MTLVWKEMVNVLEIMNDNKAVQQTYRCPINHLSAIPLPTKGKPCSCQFSSSNETSDDVVVVFQHRSNCNNSHCWRKPFCWESISLLYSPGRCPWCREPIRNRFLLWLFLRWGAHPSRLCSHRSALLVCIRWYFTYVESLCECDGWPIYTRGKSRSLFGENYRNIHSSRLSARCQHKYSRSQEWHCVITVETTILGYCSSFAQHSRKQSRGRADRQVDWIRMRGWAMHEPTIIRGAAGRYLQSSFFSLWEALSNTWYRDHRRHYDLCLWYWKGLLLWRFWRPVVDGRWKGYSSGNYFSRPRVCTSGLPRSIHSCQSLYWMDQRDCLCQHASSLCIVWLDCRTILPRPITNEFAYAIHGAILPSSSHHSFLSSNNPSPIVRIKPSDTYPLCSK